MWDPDTQVLWPSNEPSLPVDSKKWESLIKLGKAPHGKGSSLEILDREVKVGGVEVQLDIGS